VQMSNDKGYRGVGMEGRVAAWYAKNTLRDIAEFQALAHRLTKNLPADARILEVAPGPGYLSIELAKYGQYRITGLDISKTFVEIATENAGRASLKIDFQQGNASAMPFRKDIFDFIVCRAAFKNFSQPVAAMNEMYRVLRPGGRALIIDLRKDASMNDIDTYIEDARLGWTNSLIYKLTFRYMLIPRAYSKQQFGDMAARSQFGTAEIEASGIGLEVTLVK